MSIRLKFWLGLSFLVLIMAVVVVLSLLSVKQLTDSGTKVIRDNYRSLEYMQALDSLVDARWNHLQQIQDPCAGYGAWLRRLDSLVLLQRQNVTEVGERAATGQLAAAVAALPECSAAAGTALPMLEAVHVQIDRVSSLNLKAIRTKSEAAEARGSKAMQESVMVATLVLLIVLMFAASFPQAILVPLSELTRMARRLAGGAYGDQVPIDNDKDEIGQLALAFNEMSTELARYRRSSLAQLVEAQQRTEHIINRLHSPLIATDAGWRILFFNDLARQVLGTSGTSFSGSPLIGSNLLELAVRNDLLRSWLAPVTEGIAPTKDLVAVVLGKRQRYFLAEAFSISGSRSEELPLGYALTMTDVTRFRELDQAKTDFLATVAHELKTPLSTLNIGLSILKGGRSGPVSEEQEELMATMADELARLMTLINGLLDVQRIEAETITGQVEPNTVDLDGLLREIAARFQVQAEEKGARIVVKGDLGIVTLTMQADGLALAVGNLVSNAVRFSPHGGLVAIDAQWTGGCLEISVRDSGPGIPAEYRNRVFEKYYSGSSDGSGLGLFIARSVAEKAGGSLQYEPGPNGGSIFRLTLPKA